MTPDEILAKVRELRARYAALDDVSEPEDLSDVQTHALVAIAALQTGLCDLVEQLLPVALPPEPPPGKMRITGSVPVTYDVSPGQVAAYLRGEGRVRDPHSSLPGCGAAIASWTRADSHIVFAGLASDWAEHLVALLPRMAKDQGCSTGEILRDIAAMEEA